MPNLRKFAISLLFLPLLVALSETSNAMAKKPVLEISQDTNLIANHSDSSIKVSGHNLGSWIYLYDGYNHANGVISPSDDKQKVTINAQIKVDQKVKYYMPEAWESFVTINISDVSINKVRNLYYGAGLVTVTREDLRHARNDTTTVMAHISVEPSSNKMHLYFTVPGGDRRNILDNATYHLVSTF